MRWGLQALSAIAIAWICLSPVQASAQKASIVKNSCAQPVVPVDDFFENKKWDFNADTVSVSFSMYAAASADSYADNEDEFLFLPKDGVAKTGWERLNWQEKPAIGHRFESEVTGLVFDAYIKKTPACILVMVAIRGTDFKSPADWYSNASWLTNVVPLTNQYRQIDHQFAKLRKFVEQNFPGASIRYIATGHSLGGGVANHLAKCFDNVSAVTFDSSFVHNAAFCKKRKKVIVEIYDNEEILTLVRKLSGQSYKKHVNTPELSTYGINPFEMGKRRPDIQHGMQEMALGMLRAPLDCRLQKGKNCEIPKSVFAEYIKYSEIILCDNYKKTSSRFEFNDVCRDYNRVR